MSNHAHRRVIREDTLQLLRGKVGTVSDADLPGVNLPANANSSTVVNAHPGRPGASVDKSVEQRPVSNRIRSIEHALSLTVWGGDRTRVEMVAAKIGRAHV